MALAGCSHPVERRVAEYVDTAGCAQCHSEIVQAYRKTGMGRSFSKAQPVSGSFEHKASQRFYDIGGGVMSRYQIGFDGNKTNRMEHSIDYVVGSGNHARTFLHRNADGTLSELPVSW